MLEIKPFKGKYSCFHMLCYRKTHSHIFTTTLNVLFIYFNVRATQLTECVILFSLDLFPGVHAKSHSILQWNKWNLFSDKQSTVCQFTVTVSGVCLRGQAAHPHKPFQMLIRIKKCVFFRLWQTIIFPVCDFWWSYLTIPATESCEPNETLT